MIKNTALVPIVMLNGAIQPSAQFEVSSIDNESDKVLIKDPTTGGSLVVKANDLIYAILNCTRNNSKQSERSEIIEKFAE